MDHGRHMGVAEVEHIRARGIEKGGRKRIEAFAAPDHGALFDAGKSRERLQRGFDRWFTAADQRHREKINECALGLMNDGRAERVPLRLGDELRQAPCHLQIVRHRSPREAAGASTVAGKSARMARQRDDYEFHSSGVHDAKRPHYRRGRRYRHPLAQNPARRLSASSRERYPQAGRPRRW